MIHKTDNKFSAMAIDQYHDQKNAIIKGSGGAVGLTDNPTARRALDGGWSRSSKGDCRIRG